LYPGERLELPESVRIVFEVADLSHASAASISRCGMIYFDKDMLSEQMFYRHIISSVTPFKHLSS
jgi:dynein heavy chain 1